MARYAPSGGLDPSFGVGGVTLPSIQVTAPGGKTVKAKKLKALAGTASPAGSVALVLIAVPRP